MLVGQLAFIVGVIGFPAPQNDMDADLEVFSIESNYYDYEDYDEEKFFVKKSRFATTAILNYVWDNDGSHIGYNLHFDMKFGSGNIHFCMFQSTAGSGILRISGLTDFTYKWKNCTETEGAIVNAILDSINGITTEPDRTFRCLPKIKYILVSNENFDKSQIVSNIMKTYVDDTPISFRNANLNCR